MGRLTSAPQRHALALSCRQQGWQHGFLALHRLTESELKLKVSIGGAPRPPAALTVFAPPHGEMQQECAERQQS
jgi:hypothetical protein